MRKGCNLRIIFVHLHACMHMPCFTDVWLQLQHPRYGTQGLLLICAAQQKERGRFGVAMSAHSPSGRGLPSDLRSPSSVTGFCSIPAVGLFLNAVAEPQAWKANAGTIRKGKSVVARYCSKPLLSTIENIGVCLKEKAHCTYM